MRGTSIPLLPKRVSVGRDPSCDVRLDDPKVSRLHGWLEFAANRLRYIDNKSTNGSFLNGEKIAECVVNLGDILQIGNCEFALVEPADFRTISIVQSQTMVTSSVATSSVRSDALAAKFAEIFSYYRENAPEEQAADRVDIVRMQRMISSLKSLFAVSQTMAQIRSTPDLVQVVGEKLFEVFAGAENIVILLNDEVRGGMAPAHAATRGSKDAPNMALSRTVLDRAVAERVTLCANDAGSDNRLSASESIVGLKVKSVMCAPLVVGEAVLGALYIDNRSVAIHFDEMDAELVTAFANQAAIALDNARLCDQLQTSYHQTLQALVNAIEAKDPYTMGHTARVSKVSVAIAREMGLMGPRLERLKQAADLHDIGKIGIKEGIINKPGQLTEEEYEDIKLHVEYGENILKPITFLSGILPFIRGHHEKWDGTGYPDGLKGEECPLEGRIIALADAFDAMTSQRSYNKPLTFEQAFERIRGVAGRHFDPKVVEAFGRVLNRALSTSSGAQGIFESAQGRGTGPAPVKAT